MSKAPSKIPRIFVACPYSKKFKFQAFKDHLAKHYPFSVVFAETKLETKHLLAILRKHIKAADFCFFDVSLWNPNVSLELGLAEGMNAKYYILLNKKFSKDVPSDIRGLQRIEYNELLGDGNSLHNQLKTYLLKTQIPVVKEIWKKAKRNRKSEKIFDMCLRVLAHLRDMDEFTISDLNSIGKGLNLRDEDRELVVKIFRELRLIKSGRKRDEKTYILARKIFKAY